MRALFDKKTFAPTVLSALDARTKLGITFLTAVLTVSLSGVPAQAILFAATLGYAVMMKRPKLMAALYAMTVFMMGLALFFAFLLEEWLPQAAGISLEALLVPFLRSFSMMNAVMVLANTTRVEDILSTFERMRLPFAVFLPASVMMRFIPTFAADVRQVWETLRIRGWPVGFGMLAARPILTARLVLAPVLFRALKSSETLGVAAELKGLGTGERTLTQKGRTFTALDARFTAAAVVTALLVITAEITLRTVFPAAGVVMP